MSSSVETSTTTTKKQKLNNGAPLSTMSAPNPTPTPSPAPAAATTNGVQQQPQQWAQNIPIDPALQNTQASPVAYPPYAWPPQPTGAPAAPPAQTGTPTPQPIRAKTSTPAPSASPKPPTTAVAAPTATTPAPAPTTGAPYAPPYYAAAPPAGYRYPYPPQYQGQPPYAYYQAPGGQYYAVAQPPQPVQTPQTPAGGQTPMRTASSLVMPTAAPVAGTAAVQAQQQQQQQQATSTLNDALAGIVDLRAEEDALAKSHQDTGNAYFHREGDRSKRPGPALEQSKIWMSERLKAILSAQGLTNLPEEALNYAMLAWKARLQTLWDKALAAAEHRHTSQYSRAPSFWNPPVEGTTSSVPPTPMWSTLVKRDVAKQLSAIERAEKEEETRARRERRTAAAQADAEDVGEDEMDVDGRKAKKMRSVGPGVAARVMPQEMNIKSSNNTANRAAGLGAGKYAWMTAGTGGAGAAGAPAPPKPKPVATPAPAAVATPAPATPAATAATAPALKSGGWGRAYAAVTKTAAAAAGTETKDDGITVTLRDALFIASRERGFGAGQGSAVATAARWE